MPEARSPLAVALLYPSSQLGGPMRDALRELGASVVYEAMAADIDRDALEGSGARVVIVNLGADSDDYIDQLYDVLDAGDYHVVFNEAQVSDQLSGWDHARWARNLAAKIMSQPDIAEPPRPPGSVPVPTPVQTSASNVPTAEKPGPAPKQVSALTYNVDASATTDAVSAAAPEKPSTMDAPTVVLQVPEQFRTPPSADDGGMDISELEQFSALSMPDADSPAALDTAVTTLPSVEPVEISADTDTSFAAELDALFASADSTPAPVEPTPMDFADVAKMQNESTELELDIDLPPEFNLADIPGGEDTTSIPKANAETKITEHDEAISFSMPEGSGHAEEISFTMPEESEHDEGISFTMPEESEPAQSHEFDANAAAEELSIDFPAIFDQFDVSAAEIPVASDNTFKPATRPDEKADIAKAVIPAEWNLEPLHDEVPAASESSAKPEDFGIEKVSAQDFLAPEVEEPSQQQSVNTPVSDGLSLELMPMEDAIAPPSNYSHENWLDEGRPAQKLKTGDTNIQRVVVLGASIGGPEAVRDFLTPLPAGFPVLFIVAQHMGEEFLQLMAAQLRRSITLTVREPTHGEQVGNGEVLIVPTTHRLKVNVDGVVTLEHLPEKMPYSPSIDQVLRDMAERFGNKSSAIIFSGMAHDAIEGSRHMKSKGGTIWAQQPESCVVSSMVDGVRAAGLVEFTGTPAQLAEKMIAEYGVK